jgi:hypothetical protein
MKLLSFVSILVVMVGISTSSLASPVKCDADQVNLGTLTEKDDANGKEYSFAVCSSEKKKAVQIKAYPVTGTSITFSNWEKILNRAGGSQEVKWGEPYKAVNEKDNRKVTYTVGISDEKTPSKVVIDLTTVNKDGSAKEAKKLEVDLSKIGYFQKK